MRPRVYEKYMDSIGVFRLTFFVSGVGFVRWSLTLSLLLIHSEVNHCYNEGLSNQPYHPATSHSLFPTLQLPIPLKNNNDLFHNQVSCQYIKKYGNGFIDNQTA